MYKNVFSKNLRSATKHPLALMKIARFILSILWQYPQLDILVIALSPVPQVRSTQTFKLLLTKIRQNLVRKYTIRINLR